MIVKLKKLNKEEEHSNHICAASRCKHISTIIIALEGTKQYGLCIEHWNKYCEDNL